MPPVVYNHRFKKITRQLNVVLTLSSALIVFCGLSNAAADEPEPAAGAVTNTLPLYEIEPDRAALKEERQRLKAVRDTLKDEKKALKCQLRALKKKRRQACKELRATDETGQADAVVQKQAHLNRLDEQLSGLKRQKDAVGDELDKNSDLISGTKNLKIMPFAAPSYTPELGFLVSAGGLASFKTDRLDPKIQRSSVPIVFGYSSTGAMLFNAFLTSYWASDWIRFNATIWYKKMPDNYWGAGYDAGQSPKEPDETTGYDRLWWQINPELLIKLGIDDLYGGPVADFNQTQASNVNPTMERDPAVAAFGKNNYGGGVGPTLMYDSRDVPVNAFSGLLLKASALFYGNYLGSDNTYQIYNLDYRQYLTLGRPGSTLAWQMRARFGAGDVPWGELSQLGTPFDLRGYRWGRYRDKHMLFGLLEYRYMFKAVDPFNPSGFLTNHGMVLWVGAGAIGDEPEDFTDWLPNYGVGYRVELQPRMNLRLDVGFGKETHALYFNFNESF